MDRTWTRTSGALPWRIGPDGNLEVLLVHRRSRDDWSIAKGKAEPGESDQDCALREVREETGFDCRPGAELPNIVYLDRRRRVKTVRFWAATVQAGVFTVNDEVDAARWLTLPVAVRTLTQARERSVALALGFMLAGHLGISPVPAKERMLLLVRGAAAMPRETWSLAEEDRPLAPEGRAMALSLRALSAFFEIDRILSAPAARCIETVEPLARSEILRVDVSPHLSDGPIDRAMELIEDARGTGTVLCTHEEVVSGILTELARQDHTRVEPHPGRRRGSVWALMGDHARYTSAYYLPLPELSRIGGELKVLR
nr:NUDIX domain-containing protein [Cryobacterium sp. TMT1-21]